MLARRPVHPGPAPGLLIPALTACNGQNASGKATIIPEVGVKTIRLQQVMFTSALSGRFSVRLPCAGLSSKALRILFGHYVPILTSFCFMQ